MYIHIYLLHIVITLSPAPSPPFNHHPFLVFFYSKTLPKSCLRSPLVFSSSFLPSSPTDTHLVRPPETAPFPNPKANFQLFVFDKVTPSFWKPFLQSASRTPVSLGSSPTSLISLHFPLLVSLHPLDLQILECARAHSGLFSFLSTATIHNHV